MPENNMSPIARIYHFCDRWCTRCAYSAQCEAFVANEKKEIDTKTKIANDKVNHLFWQQLEQNLLETENWLRKLAAQKGVSLTEFDPPKQKKNFDLFQRDAKSNPVLKAGRLYEDMVDDWFDDAMEQFGLQTVETEQGAAIRMPDEKNISSDLKPDMLFEVILRYQLQVYLKLSRCFYSRGKEAESEEVSDEFRDSIGTAKSVLALLDRSMAAWKNVLAALPESEESIFQILVVLQRMRYNLELEFPEARAFARPGFDK